jgi:hypothetical protein
MRGAEGQPEPPDRPSIDSSENSQAIQENVTKQQNSKGAKFSSNVAPQRGMKNSSDLAESAGASGRHHLPLWANLTARSRTQREPDGDRRPLPAETFNLNIAAMVRQDAS